MNQPNDSSSSTGPPDSGQGPIDTQGVFQPPPPPPPPMYGYAPQAAPQPKRGVFWILAKGITAIGVALFFIAVGYYGAMIAVFGGTNTGVATTVYETGDGEQIVAIIPIEGMIDSDTAEFIRAALKAIGNDERVAAVVLRVDSPGGGAGASEEIHHHLTRFRDEAGKPIVASYGAMSASGGVYVSAMADYIYAQPTCITGSIGVYAPLFTYEKLIDKIGVTERWIEADGSPNKLEGNNVFREWNEEDFKVWRRFLDASYQRFHDVVAMGRGDRMSEQDLARATTGSIFLADEAKTLNLIDAIGYLEDAIAEARDRGKVTASNPMVVEYHRPRSLLEQLGVRGPGSGPGGVTLNLNELSGEQVRRILMELGAPKLMYMVRP